MRRFAQLMAIGLLSSVCFWAVPAHADWTLQEVCFDPTSQTGNGAYSGASSIGSLSESTGGSDSDGIEGNANFKYAWQGPNPPSWTDPVTVKATYNGSIFASAANVYEFVDGFFADSGLSSWLTDYADNLDGWVQQSYSHEGSVDATFEVPNPLLTLSQGMYAHTQLYKGSSGNGVVVSQADLTMTVETL